MKRRGAGRLRVSAFFHFAGVIGTSVQTADIRPALRENTMRPRRDC